MGHGAAFASRDRVTELASQNECARGATRIPAERARRLPRGFDAVRTGQVGTIRCSGTRSTSRGPGARVQRPATSWRAAGPREALRGELVQLVGEWGAAVHGALRCTSVSRAAGS